MGEISEDLKSEFKEAFGLFDKNNKGYITSEDLGTLMKKLGQNPSETELKDMIDEIDADGNGTIDFEEFLLLIQRKMKNETETRKELLEAFKMFEESGGIMKAAKLKKTIKDLTDKLTDAEVDEMIAEVDPDGTGNINLEDLVNIMLGK